MFQVKLRNYLAPRGIDGYLVNNIESACTAIQNLPQIDRRNCRQRAEDCFSASVIVDKYQPVPRPYPFKAE